MRKNDTSLKAKQIPTRWALAAIFASSSIAALAWLAPGPAIIAKESVAKALSDPLSLLELRSPGQRGEGFLYGTKFARSRVKPREMMSPGKGSPRERVLALVRDRPVSPTLMEAPQPAPLVPGAAYAPPATVFDAPPGAGPRFSPSPFILVDGPGLSSAGGGADYRSAPGS